MRKKFWIAFLVAALLCAAGCRSARQYLDRGNQRFAAGLYDDASINYRNAIKKDPQSGEAYYRLGLALLKLNKAGEGYQALTRAVALDPKNIPAKADLAKLCLAAYSNDPKRPAALYNQARTLTRELLAANANSVDGLHLSGAIALIDNQPGDAVDIFRRELRGAPDSPDAAIGLAESLLKDNKPEEGERTARNALVRHPQFTAGYELLYSYYAAQQNWEKFEALLKLWIANNPRDPALILRLAAYYYRQGKPGDAEKTLHTLLDRRTDFPQADLMAGDFHAVTHNWDLALADYQRGESRDKTREAVYQERAAGMLAMSGRRDEALKALDTILAKDAKNLFARSLKIQVLDQKGGQENLNKAAALARDLAKDSPTNARAQMIAGQALLMQRSLDEAATRFTQAAKIEGQSADPQLALARLELLRKNYALVLEHANAALSTRQADPNARLFRVIGLSGTGAYEAAKLEADQLARDTKDAPQVEMQLGIIALGQKRYSQAEAYFRKLYSEHAGDVQPLAGLVDTYVAEHLPNRALELVQSEAQKAPTSAEKAALLVATAEAAGKPETALAELQKMAVRNPTSAGVQIRIGQVEQQRGNLPKALQAFERARQLAPTLKGMDAAIGSLQDQLGQSNEAIASYRKALIDSPDDPMVLNNLAFILADTGGDLNEAMQLITKALQKSPNSGSMRDTLAWVQMKRHKTAAAFPILEALAAEFPNDATFHYHYAVALLEQGNRAGAKQEAEAALSKKPSNHVEMGLRGLLAQTK
jgi:tetratricopeptide (TPR) repeat protein